jgi:hypothetical protein
VPCCLYSDKHTVRINRDAKNAASMTQFGRALAELICANSSQAKGRVEGVTAPCRIAWWRSCDWITSATCKAGNDFLPGFLNRFNERFAVQPEKPEDLHRGLSLSADRLSDILRRREQRHVGQQNSSATIRAAKNGFQRRTYTYI